MTYNERPIERLYFNIGEVAKALQILPSKLRFYDDEFELGIHRSTKGNRKITVDQIGNLAIIVRLTEHLHLKAAKKVFHEGKAQDVLCILEEDFKEGVPLMISSK